MSFKQGQAKELVDFLTDYLARKELAPRPHIRLVGPKSDWQNEPSSIWTVADKVKTNYVGYEFTCRLLGQNPKAVTSFEFYVRVGPGSSAADFRKFSTDVSIGLNGGPCSVSVRSGGKVSEIPLKLNKKRGKEVYSETVMIGSFPVTSSDGKHSTQDVKVRFDKSRETLPDGTIRVQVKIVNESASGRLYEPSYDALTVVSALSLDDETEDQPLEEGEPPQESAPSTTLTLGALLQFELAETLSSAEFQPSEFLKKRNSLTRLFNLVCHSETQNKIILADYLSVEEFIPTLLSGRGLKQFQTYLRSKGLVIADEVGAAFEALFGKFTENPSFYAYQEEGIESLAKEIRDREGRPHLISIRTAGGKTELFLAPILDFCVKNADKMGTKALIFYPTKALANDQSRRLFDLLCELNKSLVDSDTRPITMGIYHGGVEKDMITWVPFKCTACGAYLVAPDTSKSELICTACKSKEKYTHALLTRNEIHREPPDILITNPDTMNYVLAMGGGRQSFLGRSVAICESCGLAIPNANKRKCPICSGNMLKVIPECAPEILVYDEVHLVYGAFGSNVINLNKRLTKVLGNNSGKGQPLVRIAVSATIRSPDRFGSKFFCCRPQDVVVVPADPKSAYSTGSVSSRRHALFLMPRNWSGHDTVGYSIAKMIEWVEAKSLGIPQVLCFTNNIRDCNHLIENVRNRVPHLSDRVDGHNTQFSKEDRAEVEKRFNKRDLAMLFATSTLEVGVDFSDIDVLYVYHAPANFNSYLQRVGRAGRRNDAVVVSVLNSKSANDYYYFENSRDLLENKERYMSRIPVTEANPRILEKHTIAGFFDWLQQNPDTCDLYWTRDYLGYLLQSNPSGFKPAIRANVEAYLLDVFGNEYRTQISATLDMLQGELLTNEVASNDTFNKVFDYLKEKLFFMDMRQSDPTVELKIEEVR